MISRLTVFGLLLIFLGSCKSTPPQSNTSLQILSNESFQKQIKRKNVYIHQQDQTLLIKEAYIRQDTLYAIEERVLTPEEATIVKNPVKSQDRYEHLNDVHIYVKDSVDISSAEKVIPLMSVESIKNNRVGTTKEKSKDDSVGVLILVLTLFAVIVAIAFVLFFILSLFNDLSGGFL